MTWLFAAPRPALTMTHGRDDSHCARSVEDDLVVDPKALEETRGSTLVLPPRDAGLESAEGKVISASDADLVKQITGVTTVLRSNDFTEAKMRQMIGGPPTVIYTPFAPAEGNGQSRGELRSTNSAI